MTLEDNIGDIIRKARQGMNVAEDAAAQAAGLPAAQYAQLEEIGKSEQSPNFDTLGSLIGLNGKRLAKIASGWLPADTDLTAWRELRQITSDARGMLVHCYLAWDEVTREAALFDTGTDAPTIFKHIEENQLALKHLFITHSHWDHIEVMGAIRERFPKIRIHSGSRNAPVEQRIRANDFIQVGSLRISNRATPGHAEDGVTYVVGNFPEDAPFVAMVGDAIFAGSMGGAKDHFALAREKVREQILTLPPDTLLCSGHGPLTTVAQEKANNPFFG
jgi:glyoxylase-like metal-dependent hydrolase (beta-lactamase superfamily II)